MSTSESSVEDCELKFSPLPFARTSSPALKRARTMDSNALKLKLQRYALTLPVDDVPSNSRRTELIRIFERTQLPLSRWPLAFCSLPEKAERKLHNFFTPEIHHQARLQLIAQHLPPAQRILDLGGSCGGIPQGALLNMGYLHEPDEVVIVDLSPQMQFSSYRDSTLSRPPPAAVHQHGKTSVRTIYTPMTDLSEFPAHSFDLVWSGQSIEHVSIEDAKRVFKEVARILKPDGLFCLDTPNSVVSSLLTRVGMLHPEHKFEYTAAELRELAQAAGFQVTQTLAATSMPFSRALGRYCRPEALLAECIHPTQTMASPSFCAANRV